MTQESQHHVSGTLLLAVALAAAAGFVDAWVYLNVTPVFVANMSGNLIHMGIFAGDGEWTGTAVSGLALVGFVAGVSGATWHLDQQVRAGHRPRPDALLLVESIMLLSLPVLIWATGVHADSTVTAKVLLVIVIGATAMGIQATALRRVGQIAVATTYSTGSIVRIGEKFVLALRRAERIDGMLRRTTVAILLLVLVSYVLGAAAAATLGTSVLLMFIPAVVLITAAIAVRTNDGSSSSPGVRSPKV